MKGIKARIGFIRDHARTGFQQAEKMKCLHPPDILNLNISHPPRRQLQFLAATRSFCPAGGRLLLVQSLSSVSPVLVQLKARL
jgi:hypothetical protein